MKLNLTPAAVAAFEEECLHEFYELALQDDRIGTLCEVIAELVEQLGGINRVPENLRSAVSQALGATDVLAVQHIQWFPETKGGQR